MRILQIRFQNLNSLAGAWEIDLTHPAYDANGIFAITGPTGAGKTTILDAVCLALYGRTPRLDRVSKSVNEIMSRQTGECSAEVVFETLSGKYLCKWTQRRARTRPDGELQQPQQEIANAVSGEILATGIRDVAEQVEAATGMDFDRFTRSMLLAQGGFAAFLQAGPDARAPILEQITGTEIYSRLSIQVHARRAQERAALESLENQKAALRLLSPEESDELGRLLADTEIREREESSRLATVVSAVAWKERMEGLEKNLTATNAEIEALRNRLEQFSPDRSRLKTAEIAGTIELYYVMLMSLRHDQTADQNSMDEARRELPQLEKVLEQAQIALTLAELERDRLRLALQSAQPLLRDVRALDLRLQEKQGPIHTAAVTMKALTDEQALLSGEISVAEKKLAGLVDEKASLDAVMSATSGDEALIGEMAGLEAQVAAWTQQDQLYRLKAVEFDHTTMQKEAALESSKAASIRLAEIQRELSGASALRQHAMTLAEQILEGRTAPDWRTELTLMRERKQLMDKADAISQENVAREASLQVLKAQGAALAADIVSYDQGKIGRASWWERVYI